MLRIEKYSFSPHCFALTVDRHQLDYRTLSNQAAANLLGEVITMLFKRFDCTPTPYPSIFCVNHTFILSIVPTLRSSRWGDGSPGPRPSISYTRSQTHRVTLIEYFKLKRVLTEFVLSWGNLIYTWQMRKILRTFLKKVGSSHTVFSVRTRFCQFLLFRCQKY